MQYQKCGPHFIFYASQTFLLCTILMKMSCQRKSKPIHDLLHTFSNVLPSFSLSNVLSFLFFFLCTTLGSHLPTTNLSFSYIFRLPRLIHFALSYSLPSFSPPYPALPVSLGWSVHWGRVTFLGCLLHMVHIPAGLLRGPLLFTAGPAETSPELSVLLHCFSLNAASFSWAQAMVARGQTSLSPTNQNSERPSPRLH